MSLNVQPICRELGLDAPRCRTLKQLVRDICSGKRKKRARSPWQECIAKERKGKPFDPQAIKQLAKEYRAGRCP